MPIKHAVIHQIDKKPDGTPSVLHARQTELPESAAMENLLGDLNQAYNAKTGKGWGFFHAESGAYPFRSWLAAYLDGHSNFIAFSRLAVEHLQKLMEESNLTVGGHVLFAHYQQGMTDYLTVAILHNRESMAMTEVLDVTEVRHVDLDQLHLASRINLSEWHSNNESRQYISFVKGKKGRKVSEYFRDFIGCQEGIDSPSETRTLLKAVSDYVVKQELSADEVSEITHTVINYSNSQNKLSEPVSLSELSPLINEYEPQAFSEHISTGDYGLSQQIPVDKKTLDKYARFAGRAGGLSIAFESSMLGNQVEFDPEQNTLLIRKLPSALADQLRRSTSKK
ncbi:nucleoid-associated protein YejK (plasmid) [Pseudomonas frederiksbergensis]|uniref:Nucleoid-associated protein YejK n=1 Tax=Pseudomonas frederiksbergensis TaxID=104087 RepID=A0A1J0EUG4_9PSED|nr:nucleoid-associated protein YejK [Pseudomonas frederiksbergensis]APC19472.1 nucleoid-associated protein YejK [Pseudomonas frederiksbergensis]